MSKASERLRVAIENNEELYHSEVLIVLDELKSIQEANARLSEIYSKRGETITAMRQLLDQTS